MFLEKVVELLAGRLVAGVLEHQVGHALAPVRWREVDLLALIRELGRTPCRPDGGDHHFLDETHDIPVVGVGLVTLQHRELGIVTWRQSLVAKHTPDLVDPPEPADQKPLQVQLEGDTQI